MSAKVTEGTVAVARTFPQKGFAPQKKPAYQECYYGPGWGLFTPQIPPAAPEAARKSSFPVSGRSPVTARDAAVMAAYISRPHKAPPASPLCLLYFPQTYPPAAPPAQSESVLKSRVKRISSSIKYASAENISVHNIVHTIPAAAGSAFMKILLSVKLR